MISIKLTHAALDESPLRGGTLILRGVIDANSLRNLKVDEYQRENLPLKSLAGLIRAIRQGEVLPDIEVGMRGTRTRNSDDGQTYFLQDECYIIDGQQRVNACIAASQIHGATPYLGATIHLDTNVEWEQERFRILNTSRIRVSPNVILRNLRSQQPSLQMMYSLTDPANTTFCLGGKVCWSQRMKRGEFLTALNLCKIAARLHSHLGKVLSPSVDLIGPQLDRIMERITPSIFQTNLRTYFDILDENWGIRNIQYKEMAPHLRGQFLFTLARVFSNHYDFWRTSDGIRLHLDADVRRKLKSFPLSDPGISHLCSASGKSGRVLWDYIVTHINSGRRKENHLHLRPNVAEEKEKETSPPTAPDLETV